MIISDAFLEIEDEIIQQVVQLIKADYHKKWDVDTLSKTICKSKSQLFRRIKSVTGYSTTIFVRRIRLCRAYQLLINTDQSITNIAYSVGYDNLAFFSKSFSEVYGKCPSAIRKCCIRIEG